MKFLICYTCGSKMQVPDDYNYIVNPPEWSHGHVCSFSEDYNTQNLNEVASELSRLNETMKETKFMHLSNTNSLEDQMLQMNMRMTSLEESLFLLKHKEDEPT